MGDVTSKGRNASGDSRMVNCMAGWVMLRPREGTPVVTAGWSIAWQDGWCYVQGKERQWWQQNGQLHGRMGEATSKGSNSSSDNRMVNWMAWWVRLRPREGTPVVTAGWSIAWQDGWCHVQGKEHQWWQQDGQLHGMMGDVTSKGSDASGDNRMVNCMVGWVRLRPREVTPVVTTGWSIAWQDGWCYVQGKEHQWWQQDGQLHGRMGDVTSKGRNTSGDSRMVNCMAGWVMLRPREGTPVVTAGWSIAWQDGWCYVQGKEHQWWQQDGQLHGRMGEVTSKGRNASGDSRMVNCKAGWVMLRPREGTPVVTAGWSIAWQDGWGYVQGKEHQWWQQNGQLHGRMGDVTSKGRNTRMVNCMAGWVRLRPREGTPVVTTEWSIEWQDGWCYVQGKEHQWWQQDGQLHGRMGEVTSKGRNTSGDNRMVNYMAGWVRLRPREATPVVTTGWSIEWQDGWCYVQGKEHQWWQQDGQLHGRMGDVTSKGRNTSGDNRMVNCMAWWVMLRPREATPVVTIGW